MNYRDRVMDLVVSSFSRSEVRDHAAEIANEADAEIARLRVKINSMLEILSDELPTATRRRVGARFNAELDNRP